MKMVHLNLYYFQTCLIVIASDRIMNCLIFGWCFFLVIGSHVFFHCNILVRIIFIGVRIHLFCRSRLEFIFALDLFKDFVIKNVFYCQLVLFLSIAHEIFNVVSKCWFQGVLIYRFCKELVKSWKIEQSIYLLSSYTTKFYLREPIYCMKNINEPKYES